MNKMLNSYYRPLCRVDLPFRGRQKYMHAFDLSDPKMEDGYEDYLEPVKNLCAAAGAKIGVAYLTVDEKIVQPGTSQRRPRPHVDGCFIVEGMAWGHPTPPAWAHNCNNLAGGDKLGRMPVIVASSVAGCRIWEGQFKAEPKEDGDLSHIGGEIGSGEIAPANIGYLLSPDCVHESMIFNRAAERSFMRIALPVNFRC